MDEVDRLFVVIQIERTMDSSESSSDNEMGTLQEYYQDPEPKEMIGSMLGKLFDEPSELSAKKIKLDEETF